MPLKLHSHPLASFCWKVLIALYERDVPFESELLVLDPTRPESGAEFRKLWPMAKMPLLEDATAGWALPESSLIIEHLDHIRPGAIPLVPPEWESARKVRFWDRFFDQYVHVPMQTVVYEHLRPADERDDVGAAQARQTLRTAYDYAERELAGRTWAAGEAFSMADCAAAPALHYAEKVEPFTRTHPGLAAYLERLEARPSFARVLKEAEPYAHMFPVQPEHA